MIENPLRGRLRAGSLPHFFCAGCGAAQVLTFFLQAAEEIGLDFDRLVAIGGVGCSARLPVYLDVDAMHGIHGRTLPMATGIKLHKPDLKVVIFAGDGDAAAIGGNHLIQAARRNLDVTMIVITNLVYAMTGGQAAPTTTLHAATSTTPYGNRERRFDLCALVQSAGATFVSRSTTAQPRLTINMMKRALQHRGFALLEIISQCPTYFGRNALGTDDPVRSVEWIKEHSVALGRATGGAGEEFVVGTFVDTREPVFDGS